MRIMKKRNISLVLMAMTFLSLALSSCLGDNDDDIVYTDDAAVTAFTLGTLNQYTHYTSSLGTDSIVKTTVTGSLYRFYIDQMKREIYNPDSLPYGTDAAHVVCTIVARNSGSVILEGLGDDNAVYYSSSDSIDFTQPRTIVVYSNSGKGSNRYTIRVNVHQQQPDVFNWALLSETPGATPFATEGYRHIVTFGQRMLTLQDNALWQADSWSEAPTWNKVCDVTGIRQLAGATPTHLYALNDEGRLVVSSNAPEDWASGIEWKEEQLDSDLSLLPDTEVRMVCLPSKTNRDTYHLVLVGSNSRLNTTDNMTVWSKVEENDAYAEQGRWFYYTPSTGNKNQLPGLSNLQLVAYDGGLLAFGTQADGTLSPLYLSRDMGITWPETKLVNLPEEFSPTDNAYGMTADSDNYLWLADGTKGKTWRGRLNRLGWKEVNKTVTE